MGGASSQQAVLFYYARLQMPVFCASTPDGRCMSTAVWSLESQPFSLWPSENLNLLANLLALIGG